MIIKATKKPIEVEAIKFTGDNFSECNELMMGGKGLISVSWHMTNMGAVLSIETDGKKALANKGDYIVKSDKGYITICKPNEFADIYNIVG